MPPAARPVPLEQTRALRQAVLRPYLTVDDLAEHEPPDSVAFGAFDGDDLVAVGLVGPEGEPGAWRIRGMATAPQARGRGAGTAVLGALLRHASAHGATSVWCNARVRAIPLYERAGLRVVSDVFEPPDIGPHVRMELPVFQGFRPEVFAWFAGLERDNTKTYFTATRDLYEHDVRGGLEALLDELAMEFGGEARVFRQQRDLRFTPDKTPYKTRTYGVIGGTSVPGAGLYAQLSVNGLYAGTGYWRLARDQLERYRAAVDDARRGGAGGGDGGGAGRRPRALRGEPEDGAARLPARPPADRAAAPQVADRGPRADGRGRHRPRRRARPRRRGVAGRGAAERLARRARRAEHPAARAARRAPLSGTGTRTPVREMARSRAPRPAAILPVPPLPSQPQRFPHA